MSKVIQLHRRKFIAGGVLIGMTILLFHLRSTHDTIKQPSITNTISTQPGAWALVQTGTLPNPFYTPAVQNIENRYSALGGAKNHQPAVATKKGDSGDVAGRQETQKGMGTPHHQEKIGEQRSDVSQLLLAQPITRSIVG